MSAANNLECEGKVALITGASRGIGAAIAERLAEAGAKVAVAARTLDPDPKYDGSVSETVARIRAAGGTAIGVQSDISKGEDRARMVQETVDQLGPVDILVNNAAVTFLLPIDTFPKKRFDLMFEVQVWAPYELTQLVLPGMRANGAGWILNITSRAGVHPQGPPFQQLFKDGGWTVYGMVKAALDRFTTAAAPELYDANIAVNSLAPWDNVVTPGAGAHDLVDGFAIEDISLMAEAALALCSGDPKQLTGGIEYSQPLLARLQRRPPVR
ncbi:MAG: SDR family NAD(P)-dependent oxidoreductase [Actinomycetota bacterium]|nr:SDR family NAD(P)-dependent oxidoreductase [Actinomycetota bacterium]